MILVVDDDFAFLELATRMLNKDRKVFLACDSQQAWELLQHFAFSVALVNLDLKGPEGLMLIQRLREAVPQLPLIAISATLATAEIAAAKRFGIAEVLQKPITVEWKRVVERVSAEKS